MTHDASGEATVGQGVRRVDGRAKVTGQAKYAAELTAPGLLHGVVVSSHVARGRIARIDMREALRLDGVVHVFTHENRPSLAWFDRSYRDQDAPKKGSPFRPLRDAQVVYSGQPVALVVARTFELARRAAALVQVTYDVAPHQTNLAVAREDAYDPGMAKDGFEPPPKPRGDADGAFARAKVRVDASYHTPVEHHNPMECHASTVIYEDDGMLTVYDKTQGVLNSLQYLTRAFGLQKGKVRVRSPFVGGAFGSALRPQYQLALAVMAARELHRSVRVSLTRKQMFTFGHRPETFQRVALAANEEGVLEAVIHEAVGETSRFEDYVEVVVNWSGLLYQCDNVRLGYEIAQVDNFTPLDMRAPGAALGVFALESAIDELSYAVGVDPLAIRLRNYAERDQNKDLPFSSKELRACYQQGAERFGWARRTPAPRSMRDGSALMGWGVATGAWDAMQQKARARAVLSVDGSLTVSSATADIGTGTYTVMTQIAADASGVPIDRVRFELGDTTLPESPLQGGSWTVSSVGTAVQNACEALRDALRKLAQGQAGSPLAGAAAENLACAGGRVSLRSAPNQGVSYTDVLRAAGKVRLEVEAAGVPDAKRQAGFTRATHSAVFVEVKVDEALGTVQVTRVVSAIAGGRIVNPKTARSQIVGGVVWGIGMALHEESRMDPKLGRFVNHDFAEYHIPVNADVQDIDVLFVDEDDTVVNPLGAKGLGEIGIVGVAAAIANAVYHATGTRVRSLPITLDKLL
ncbi:MAG: xanthine dehydrogenase family protein molybdopterin-binding subunit [Polyangiales bacterium]